LIKVSRNFAFNENNELHKLEIYTDLPGLVDVEGENEEISKSSNPTTSDTAPKTETPTLPPINTPKPPENITVRPVHKGRKSLDYRKINNPLAQPLRQVPAQTAPQEVSRPTAASAARPTAQEIAHLAHDTLIEKLEQ